jgi:uncharacterized protein YuzE
MQAMKIRYFQDTDTLYIELRPARVSETHEVDEDTVMDLDERGAICAMTIEHTSERADIPNFSDEQQGRFLTD